MSLTLPGRLCRPNFLSRGWAREALARQRATNRAEFGQTPGGRLFARFGLGQAPAVAVRTTAKAPGPIAYRLVAEGSLGFCGQAAEEVRGVFRPSPDALTKTPPSCTG